MVLLCKSPSVEVLVIDDGRVPSVKLESQAPVATDVDGLRKKFGLPRMRILQSAFASDASDRFLPHNHERDTVVYTGTHDNDTSAGGWATATDHERTMARGYLATEDNDMPWTLIRADTRLTLRGGDHAQPRGANGARLSGSYLGPHRQVQQGRL